MIRYIKENPHCHKCEHCENKHLIDDLNGKLDKYFCTLSYRIAKHISDLDIHVTKEKKDYWDAKAEQSSVDALDDNIKNTLDELNQFKDAFGDVNNFVKNGDLEGFATNDFVKTYVESVIKGYATKEYVNNQINSWFDKSNYYTKSQVDSLLNKNYSDYSITSLDYADGVLTIKQNNIENTKSVNIGTSNGNVPGGGSISQEAFDDMLKASKTIHTLNINNKSYNPVVSDVNMTITGGSGSGSGGYYKPYFKNTTYYDSFPRSEMPTDGSAPKSDSGWSDQQKNPNSGQYTWMTQVFIDTAGNYGSYMNAIRLTGENGTAGEDGSLYEYIYRRQNQNQALPIKPDNEQQDGYVPDGWSNHPEGIDQDNRYEYICYRTKDKSTNQWVNWFGPYLWSAYGENGTDGDGVEYIYYVGLTKPTGSLQDPSKWDTSVSDFQNDEYILENSGWTDNPTDLTEQGQKQYVSVRKKHDNVCGAYSEPALWSYYSVDGGSSQTSVGSPLRMVGGWISGHKYYDGKRATSDGVFYQDVILYNNTYYACVDTEEGERNNWVTTPDKAQYFSAFSLTTDQMVKLLIANKAFIKELSSNEVVIMDDDTIVAGMTSGKSIDSDSLLNGKVKNKGDVRIWAGQPTSEGDLATAPFTVTDTGILKSTNANISGQINATSGSIGNFNISDGSLITGNSKLEIGTVSSNPSYKRKVTIDANGNDLQNYNYMLSVEHNRMETSVNVGTTAGIYIDVAGSSNLQYCGINMPRGQFWGLRCTVRKTEVDLDLANLENWAKFVSGMTVICTSTKKITITLPNKDFAKEGDEFTVLKGNDDYQRQEVALSWLSQNAVGQQTITGMGARIIFANGKWRVCHYS